MNVASELRAETGTEHFDVLVVGAGISGIDAGHHLTRRMPGTRFAILEMAEGLGGTWLTHRFPGIRSDSDLYTFGYGWKPWLGKTLATAGEILDYLEEAVEEEGLAPHIRYGQAVRAADWSEAERRWTLTVEDLASGGTRPMTCRFLWMCQGYYDHRNGYMPDYPEQERFAGPVVHPQHWPEDMEIAGKRFAVIGSGATAATIVPALAREAAHVTVVQRSPTYFYPKPLEHELAALLRPLDLPDEWFHEIMRRRILLEQAETTRRSFEEPEALQAELQDAARAYLGNSCAIDPHFSPTYRVWRQRLAVVPDGDLFRAIHDGRASMVTGRVARFTETGLETEEGDVVEADAIVSATGLNLSVMGGVPFTVDGRAVDFAQTVMHLGSMFTGVPNMAWTFGYIRASWTMRADMISAHVCRLLAHMAETGAKVVEPRLRPQDEGMAARPFIDPENFDPGYMTRSMHLLPKQGDRPPWTFSQDYEEEKTTIPGASLTDGSLIYR